MVLLIAIILGAAASGRQINLSLHRASALLQLRSQGWIVTRSDGKMVYCQLSKTAPLHELDAVLQALEDVPGLRLQERFTQGEFKVSYFVDPNHPPNTEILQEHLHLYQRQITAHVVLSHMRYLDTLPIRASTGHSIRFFAFRWGMPLKAVLTVGDSGNDADMMGGEIRGVIVGNHSPELGNLKLKHYVYFASAYHAWGILEGISHYRFPGVCEDV